MFAADIKEGGFKMLLATHSISSKQISTHLNHDMLREAYTSGELDLYEGEKDEKSYLLWDDGTAETVYWGDIALILNDMSTVGGVEESTEQILARSGACERTVAKMHGEETENKYIKRIHCNKWWCPTCGSWRDSTGKIHVGHIQRERRKSIYARLNGGFEILDKNDFSVLKSILDNITMVQYVFTVPFEYRCRFDSKDGLNRLFGSVKRIMSKYYPGTAQIAYMHVTGDESIEFNPHVNVHIFIEGDVRVCPPKGKIDKQLYQIKMSWARALRGHGCAVDGNRVDIHKSFVAMKDTFKKKLHRIKYMTKTIDQGLLLQWRMYGRQDMIDLTVKKMRGFRYIRYWGELSNTKYKDWNESILIRIGKDKEEIDEMKIKKLRTKEERLAGERLVLDEVCLLNIEELKKNPGLRVVEISEDFYRIEYLDKEKKHGG